MAGGREASGGDLKARRHPCRCLSAAASQAFGTWGFKLVGLSVRRSFRRTSAAKLRVPSSKVNERLQHMTHDMVVLGVHPRPETDGSK